MFQISRKILVYLGLIGIQNLNIIILAYGTKFSRMDQVKFEEGSL